MRVSISPLQAFAVPASHSRTIGPVQAYPPSLEGAAGLLAVLADGMGGMPGGERASRTAVRGFIDGYLQENAAAGEGLHGALHHANRQVAAVVESQPDLDGMGCTVVGVLVFERRLEWISVGDSLILLYRAGRIRVSTRFTSTQMNSLRRFYRARRRKSRRIITRTGPP